MGAEAAEEDEKTAQDNVLEMFRAFTVDHCACFSSDVRDKLLCIIEAGCGKLENFDALVRATEVHFSSEDRRDSGWRSNFPAALSRTSSTGLDARTGSSEDQQGQGWRNPLRRFSPSFSSSVPSLHRNSFKASDAVVRGEDPPRTASLPASFRG